MKFGKAMFSSALVCVGCVCVSTRELYSKLTDKFWKASVEHKPLATVRGKITPNILITTDHIFIKILPEMHLGPRKSAFHF